MTDLLALAKRCEDAAGPDRELDADIAVALGHKIKMAMANYTMEMFPAIEWQAPHPYAGMKEPCPEWTGQIDAALKLVPAAAYWIMDAEGWAMVRDVAGSDHIGRSATAALALSAAALHAMAAIADINGSERPDQQMKPAEGS